MECKIPVRSFAIAAAEASALFDCRPEVVFDSDSHASTRARAVAVAAMVKVFPKVKRISIAQGFNLKLEQSQLAAMVAKARKHPWWDEGHVDAVVRAVKRDLIDNPGAPHVEFDDRGNIDFVLEDDGAPVLKEPEREVVADKYTPRRFRPARIIMPNASRPGNVTASLLGDPPRGRREELAAMQSPYYSAGNESGRFGRYRGKRVLEAAE